MSTIHFILSVTHVKCSYSTQYSIDAAFFIFELLNPRMASVWQKLEQKRRNKTCSQQTFFQPWRKRDRGCLFSWVRTIIAIFSWSFDQSHDAVKATDPNTMQEVLLIILLMPGKKDFQVLPLSWVIVTSHSLPSSTSFPHWFIHHRLSFFTLSAVALSHLSSGTQERSVLPCPEVSILNTSLSHPYQLLLRTDFIPSCPGGLQESGVWHYVWWQHSLFKDKVCKRWWTCYHT